MARSRWSSAPASSAAAPSDEIRSRYDAADEEGRIIDRVRGICTVMFAFDVGYGIDLAAARRLVGGELVQPITTEPPTPRRGGAAPRPLRVKRNAISVDVNAGEDRWATQPGATVSLWDFGGASVSLRIEIDSPLEDLVALSTALYGNTRLIGAARAIVDDLLRALGDSVASPEVSALVEDYAAYELSCPSRGGDSASLVPESREVIARILRAESKPLSTDETAEALATSVSYAPGDLCLVDWNAAVLLGPELGDNAEGNAEELGVLEYANVELLELRALDDRLDAALDSAFAAAHRGRWWAEAADLETVAKLQVEAALLFEAVNNAAKLIGDQYLSRLYRAAAKRLHLSEWDATILRKIETLESLYEKMNDRRTNRKMEILEWIIIILIFAEIVMSLVPWRGW